MTSKNSIFSFGNISDPIQRAKAALRASRQYRREWQEQGVNRVYEYFDDVEGDWLENFEPISIDRSLKQISKTKYSDIVAQLKSIGLSHSFIEKIVYPSWWEKKFENDNNAIYKLLKSISKRLLLEIDFLEGSSAELSLKFVPIPSPKFKLQKRQEKPELFSYLARSITNTILKAVDHTYVSISNNPLEIRESILRKNPCVNLNSLVDFCWGNGIPVVHFDLSSIFSGKNKPTKSDGLVVIVDSRPAIVIGSSRQHSAWLLFILAHELGHIACGHLQEGILSDGSFQDGVNDEEEEVANDFATQLLFGDVPIELNSVRNKKQLLSRAMRLSKTHQLDTGSVILRYAWQTGHWGCAVAALNLLEPDANAPQKINSRYQNHLKTLDEDSQDYLRKSRILAT